MVYYFSGTGNSRYAAMRLGSLLNEEVKEIPLRDPFAEDIDLSKDKSVGFVFPVYAWGVPPIVMNFIGWLPDVFWQTVRERRIPVWCVATCGDETGMAVSMLRRKLRKRGIKLSGAWSLIMPNVYVLLPGFGVDPKEVEAKKLSDAVGRIGHIAACIRSGIWVEDVHVGSFPRTKTTLVYPLFKRWGVNSKKWHYTDACTGCGKCERACPVGNITMPGGHPHWMIDCISCCACYHVCPTRAVQYGDITKNAGQYYCNLKA